MSTRVRLLGALTLALMAVTIVSALELVLTESDGAVSVDLRNDSPVPCSAPEAMQLGVGFLGNLDFAIRDANGVERPLMVKIDNAPLSMSNMEPGAVLHASISVERLIEFYDLEPGPHTVKAMFVYSEKRPGILSNQIVIQIQKKTEPGATDNPDGAQRLREDQ